jgi:hypothetical protein
VLPQRLFLTGRWLWSRAVQPAQETADRLSMGIKDGG